MNTTKILQHMGLKPSVSIYSLNNKAATDKLSEFIKEWGLSIQISKIGKQDWQKLLSSYADSIIDYHPEDDHQERAVFLKNEHMLKKYGLTDEDVKRLDFC